MEEISSPNKNRLIRELIKGRDSTNKLQNLLHGKIYNDGVLLNDLLVKITESVSNSLSMLISLGPSELSRFSGRCNDRALDSDESGKKPKDQRGWYKRSDIDTEQGSSYNNYGNLSHEVGGVSGYQAPSIGDMARDNMSSGSTRSYSCDQSAPSWNALQKQDSSSMMIDTHNMQEFMGGEFGHRAPSIGDMARDNISQPLGGTHSYSRDQSPPSWNALNKQDSSLMIIDSDDVQEFVGEKFGQMGI